MGMLLQKISLGGSVTGHGKMGKQQDGKCGEIDRFRRERHHEILSKLIDQQEKNLILIEQREIN